VRKLVAHHFFRRSRADVFVATLHCEPGFTPYPADALNTRRLSAHLAELTGEPASGPYHTSAQLSANFLQTFMHDGADDLIGDTMDLDSCVVVLDAKSSHSSGAAIAAFALLANLTGDVSLVNACGGGLLTS
jgi:hypothetical protein